MPLPAIEPFTWLPENGQGNPLGYEVSVFTEDEEQAAGTNRVPIYTAAVPEWYARHTDLYKYSGSPESLMGDLERKFKETNNDAD